jgi:TRAP-type C4-dicarboxylate transport system permease small subunit
LAISLSISLAFFNYEVAQVKFSLVVDRLPFRQKTFAEIITLAIGMILFGLIAWQAIKRSIYSFKTAEFIGAMEIPFWPFKLIFAIGCFLTSLALMVNFFIAIQRLLRGKK